MSKKHLILLNPVVYHIIVQTEMRYLFVVLIFCGQFLTASAQLGGRRAFSVLALDNSARVAALGGSTIALFDNDVNQAYQNPALINPKMHHRASLSYVNYLADINNGSVGYARHFDGLGTFSGNIFYINYGHFDETDETGRITGSFGAYDYNFQIGYGQEWKENFRYGAAVKFVYSVYEAFVATAGAIDLGGVYHNPETKFTATVVMKNLGYNFIPYNDTREPLPFEIQAGISKKLEHNPLKFGIIAHNLQQPNLSYVNPNRRNKEIDLETGQVINPEPGLGDKIMRHFIFNGELVFSENFQLCFGYNHMRRKELAPENRKAVTGFSWGFNVSIKRFEISYGSASYFPGIASNTFTVSKDLADFRK